MEGKEIAEIPRMKSIILDNPMLSYLTHVRELYNGGQLVFEFENGHEVSIIQHDFSYGHEDGLFELYDSQYGDGDPIGWLTVDECFAKLKEIKEINNG